MDLDAVCPITDFSIETLLQLAQRLEQSSTFEELLVREIELDEVWRRVDTILRRERESGAEAGVLSGLERLWALVFEAHDLAASDRPQEAAERLRHAMSGSVSTLSASHTPERQDGQRPLPH